MRNNELAHTADSQPYGSAPIVVIALSFFRNEAERLEPIGSVGPYPYSPNHEHRKDEGDDNPFGGAAAR